ncbi:BlaI/MecI/CopY family transcriptional regulator [Lachnospiraceae bacterium 62-35]
MEELKLYEGEYRFMDLIWEKEPVRSMDLAKEAFRKLGWKKSTSYTVLKKLGERGFIKNEQAVVRALVTREEVGRYESEELLKKSFHNSLPAFLTSFLKDRKLSQEEAEEIMKMIKEAAE